MAQKSEQTRQVVLDTALRLFRQEGYAATTMRRIATEAGLSPSNAYYYFSGKDELVQELYRQLQVEHRQAAAPGIEPGARLEVNLAHVLHRGLDTNAPYHAFGSTLLASALAPGSPVNPFGPDQAEAREAATGLMAEVVRASSGVPGGALGERLPHLLWLAYMGVTLFWVLDTSEEQRRTRVLVDGAAPLISRVLRLSRLPVGRGLTEDALGLMDRLTTGAEQADGRA